MKQIFNYTGRRKIGRGSFSISVNRRNGAITSFVLDQLNIGNLGLPGNTRVCVEAYYRTELKRFDCGTVGDMRLPLTGDLTDMAYTQNLKFRILIADPTNWNILAHANRIAPTEAAERSSILPVEFCDLGTQVWCVKYEGENSGPILCLNNVIPSIENIAKHDPQFFVHVYPPVVREILKHMVFVDGVDSVSDPSVDWHKEWLKFASILGIQIPRILNQEDNDFDKDEALKWIGDVVDGFCNVYASKFREFLARMEERL